MLSEAPEPVTFTTPSVAAMVAAVKLVPLIVTLS